MQHNKIVLTVSLMKRRNFLKTITSKEKSPSGNRPRIKLWFACDKFLELILVLVFLYYISSYGVSDEWFSILLSLVKLFSYVFWLSMIMVETKKN